MGRRFQHGDGDRRRTRRHRAGTRFVLRQRVAGRARHRQFPRLHALRLPQQSQGRLLRSQSWLSLRQRFMKLRLAIFFVALAATALTGCATHLPGHAAKTSCCAKAEPPTTFTDKSLYQLDSLWTTDEDRQIKLSELSGRPQIVAMFFANCQIACPIILNDMKRIEAALPADVRPRVGLALVSFDGKRDTPACLADYR